MKSQKRIKYAIGAVIAGAAIFTIMGLATMVLWNWLIPTIFNGAIITFWQAIGLILLVKLLTGFSGMGGWKHKRGWKGHSMHDRSFWRQRMEEKMEKMSPEEKEKFKKYYYDRCGWKFNKENEEAFTQTEETQA